MNTKIKKFETKINHDNSAISANLSANPLNHRNIEQEFMVNADGGVYLGNLRKGDKITINKAPKIEKPEKKAFGFGKLLRGWALYKPRKKP